MNKQTEVIRFKEKAIKRREAFQATNNPLEYTLKEARQVKAKFPHIGNKAALFKVFTASPIEQAIFMNRNYKKLLKLV